MPYLMVKYAYLRICIFVHVTYDYVIKTRRTPGFLKLVFVREVNMHVCVCVCPPLDY